MKPVFHPPFLLLQEDSYSITPNRTSIWIVTLPKIWFIFRQNGCQTQKLYWSAADALLSQGPSMSRFLCTWEGDNQKGRLKKQAYLISSASDTAEWDHKVSAVQELWLQIVALSSAGVYLLDWGGGWGNDKANDYLCERSACGLESCFWCCLHCVGYGRLMWNFTANKSGQRGKSQREAGGAAGCRREEKGEVW